MSYEALQIALDTAQSNGGAGPTFPVKLLLELDSPFGRRAVERRAATSSFSEGGFCEVTWPVLWNLPLKERRNLESFVVAIGERHTLAQRIDMQFLHFYRLQGPISARSNWLELTRTAVRVDAADSAAHIRLSARDVLLLNVGPASDSSSTRGPSLSSAAQIADEPLISLAASSRTTDWPEETASSPPPIVTKGDGVSVKDLLRNAQRQTTTVASHSPKPLPPTHGDHRHNDGHYYHDPVRLPQSDDDEYDGGDEEEEEEEEERAVETGQEHQAAMDEVPPSSKMDLLRSALQRAQQQTSKNQASPSSPPPLFAASPSPQPRPAQYHHHVENDDDDDEGPYHTASETTSLLSSKPLSTAPSHNPLHRLLHSARLQTDQQRRSGAVEQPPMPTLPLPIASHFDDDPPQRLPPPPPPPRSHSKYSFEAYHPQLPPPTAASPHPHIARPRSNDDDDDSNDDEIVDEAHHADRLRLQELKLCLQQVEEMREVLHPLQGLATVRSTLAEFDAYSSGGGGPPSGGALPHGLPNVEDYLMGVDNVRFEQELTSSQSRLMEELQRQEESILQKMAVVRQSLQQRRLRESHEGKAAQQGLHQLILRACRRSRQLDLLQYRAARESACVADISKARHGGGAAPSSSLPGPILIDPAPQSPPPPSAAASSQPILTSSARLKHLEQMITKTSLGEPLRRPLHVSVLQRL